MNSLGIAVLGRFKSRIKKKRIVTVAIDNANDIDLKSHVYKQDEEIYVLKDMLRSSTMQMKLRDSEIHRLKMKLKSLGVEYKN